MPCGEGPDGQVSDTQLNMPLIRCIDLTHGGPEEIFVKNLSGRGTFLRVFRCPLSSSPYPYSPPSPSPSPPFKTLRLVVASTISPSLPSTSTTLVMTTPTRTSKVSCKQINPMLDHGEVNSGQHRLRLDSTRLGLSHLNSFQFTIPTFLSNPPPHPSSDKRFSNPSRSFLGVYLLRNKRP